MSQVDKKHADLSAVPLQSAVLCVDCECVTDGRSDECLVCGSRSLLSVARIVGGTLLSREANRPKPETHNVLYDLEITVELKLIAAKDLSATVEGIATLIEPRLGRGRACCHLKVTPVVDRCTDDEVNAA
jgi:hypothetical protein